MIWIWLLFSMLACTDKQQQQESPMFSYKGKDLQLSDLNEEARADLYEAERRYHQEIENSINSYIVKDFLADQAKKTGRSVDEVETDMMTPKPPTDTEIKKFYDDKKDKIPYPFDVVKEELRKIMVQDRKLFAKSDLIAKAREAGNFKLLIEKKAPPALTVNISDRPSKGNPKARTTVVEFADYRCPHCGEAFGKLKELWPKLEGDINFVFMDFPLHEEEDGDSFQLAKGAYCAKLQGKFWEYHDAAYSQQSTMTKDYVANVIKNLELDRSKFDVCVKSAEALAYVKSSRKEGVRLNVRSTPSFFVNGVKVNSDTDLHGLQAAIDSSR